MLVMFCFSKSLMDRFGTCRGLGSTFSMLARFVVGKLRIVFGSTQKGTVNVCFGLILFLFAVLAGISAQMPVCWGRSG